MKLFVRLVLVFIASIVMHNACYAGEPGVIYVENNSKYFVEFYKNNELIGTIQPFERNNKFESRMEGTVHQCKDGGGGRYYPVYRIKYTTFKVDKFVINYAFSNRIEAAIYITIPEGRLFDPSTDFLTPGLGNEFFFRPDL